MTDPTTEGERIRGYSRCRRIPTRAETPGEVTSDPKAGVDASPTTATPATDEDPIQLLKSHFPPDVVAAFGYCDSLEGKPSSCMDDSSSTTSSSRSSTTATAAADASAFGGTPHEEFLYALQIAPRVVLTETPFERYLSEFWTEQDASTVSSSNHRREEAYRKAADKIASHWRIRREVFGEERYHLPMILPSPPPKRTPDGTGIRKKEFSFDSTATSNKRIRELEGEIKELESALPREDMEIINTGWLTIPPRGLDAAKGRAPLAIDRSLLGDKEATEQYDQAKLRIIFYFIYVLCSTRPEIVKEGMVVLVNALIPVPLSQYCSEGIVKIRQEAFPIATSQVHALFYPSRIKSFGSLLASVLMYLNQNVLRRYNEDCMMHFGMTDENLIQNLVEAGGFNRSDLPLWFSKGSDWDLLHFYKWLNSQYQSERSLYMTPEAKNLKRRVDNMKRSQAKRDREKSLEEELKLRAENLVRSNVKAWEENLKLEKLLEHAQKLRKQAVIEDVQQLGLILASSKDQEEVMGDIATLIPEGEELCALSLFDEHEEGQKESAFDDTDAKHLTQSVELSPCLLKDDGRGKEECAQEMYPAAGSIPVAEELCNFFMLDDDSTNGLDLN